MRCDGDGTKRARACFAFRPFRFALYFCAILKSRSLPHENTNRGWLELLVNWGSRSPAISGGEGEPSPYLRIHLPALCFGHTVSCLCCERLLLALLDRGWPLAVHLCLLYATLPRPVSNWQLRRRRKILNWATIPTCHSSVCNDANRRSNGGTHKRSATTAKQ